LSLAIPISLAVVVFAGFLLVWMAIRNVQSELGNIRSSIANQPQGDSAQMSAHDPAPAKKASTGTEKAKKTR
jgi:hypothetical protein